MPDAKCTSWKAAHFPKALLVLATLSAHAVTRDVPTPPTAAEQLLLSQANEDRALNHLPPVRRDPQLSQAALYHAFQMAEHADISHGFNGEPDLSERGASAGVHFSLITENVAEAADASIIHTLWMNSSGHRANVLDPAVNVAGIAVVIRNNQAFAVEDLAETADTMSMEEQESVVVGLLKTAGIKVAGDPQSLKGARQTCGMTTSYAGMRQPWFVMRYTVSQLNQLPDQVQGLLKPGLYHEAVVGACPSQARTAFTSYRLAILLYP